MCHKHYLGISYQMKMFYQLSNYTVFHIRDEIKWNIVVGVVAASLYIGLSLILNVRPQTTGYCIQATIGGINLFLFTAIPTGYALYKFNLPRNYLKVLCGGHKYEIHKEYMAEHIDLNTDTSDKDDQSTTQSTQQSMKITLKTILEDPEGFELFARHLAREFAIVSLCFCLFFHSDENIFKSFFLCLLFISHQNHHHTGESLVLSGNCSMVVIV